MIIREMPTNERPREKMLREGKDALSNGELIAILLGTGTREKTAIRLADELLTLDDKGLIFLQECSIEEIKSIKGVGLAKASKIVAAIEIGKRIATMPREKKLKIESTKDVVSIYMERMRYYEKEFFNALLLNTKGNIIGNENITVGDLSSSIVHPRETFKNAIKRGAYAIILIHNHPSGNPAPSKEDIEVTKRLCKAGSLLGINVLDHIIIGDGTYISFKEKGII